jgi:hypothetical protein
LTLRCDEIGLRHILDMNSLRKPILLLFSLSVLSAILFIFLVSRPVYDDVYNILDARGYAYHGISTSTILAQKNAPGPGSFIWMAAGILVFGQNELRDARLAILTSWVMLVTAALVAVRRSRFSELWLSSILATIVFPYSLTAMATLLTEGPSLFFAIVGTIAWTEAVSRRRVNLSTFAATAVGGLAIGLAVVCRQYYLALLPAAMVFALFLFRRREPQGTFTWLASIVVSLLLVSTPPLLLFTLWHGLSCPGISQGTSYATYHADAGLNFSRPIVTAFAIGFYLVPLTFPAPNAVLPKQRLRIFLGSSVIGVVAVPFHSHLVDKGIIHSLTNSVTLGPFLSRLAFWAIATLVAYNSISLALLSWAKRNELSNCYPVVFALLTVLFFVFEQFGVGGNIPFYDRYVLQMVPFLGLIAFFLVPERSIYRTVSMAVMYLLGQEMLWRHAITIPKVH